MIKSTLLFKRSRERRNNFPALCVLSSMLYALCSSLAPSAFAAPGKQNVAAIVISFSGKFSVKPSGSTKFEPAKKGQFLYEGDTVKTEKNSLASITFANGVQIKINASTEFVINMKQLGSADEGSELNMKKGQIWSKVMRKGTKFGVRTPVALAAVRGTEFDVELSPSGGFMALQCYEGVVNVENEFGSQEVKENEKTSVSGGSAPNPPQPLTSEDKDKKDWTDKIKSEEDDSNSQKDEPAEKVLKMEVETPTGKKTLKMKFKK